MTQLKILACASCAGILILFTGGCMNNTASSKSGTVIILNGPSSVGKSSIIKAFQAKQSTPWLETGIDHLYVGVISPQWLDDKPKHHAVMSIKSSQDKTVKKIVTAIFGPEGQKIIGECIELLLLTQIPGIT